jgi:hypothetical protein
VNPNGELKNANVSADAGTHGGTDGTGLGLKIITGVNYSWNYTIDHNVLIDTAAFMTLDSSTERQSMFSSGFSVTNNIFQYGDRGIEGSSGDDSLCLNTYANGIRITNIGVGYTSAPTVSLVVSSIRMKLPVARLSRYSSTISGVLVRRCTRPIS